MKALRVLFTSLLATVAVGTAAPDQRVAGILDKIDSARGIVGLLGLFSDDPNLVVNLARESELTVYFQSPDPDEVKPDHWHPPRQDIPRCLR